MATPPSPPSVNIWLVLSESRRIINTNARHFLALSVLFLLPNYVCISVFPTVYRHLITDQSAAPDYKTLVLLAIAYIIMSIINLIAIGSIVYSVFQGFYERPVKFISAVKSSLSSFFPLLATLNSTTFIIYGIFLILAHVAFLLTTVLEIIIPGLEISFLAFTVIVMIIGIVVMFKFQVDWILSLVIVVVESVWGLKSLKRSKILTKGMRRVSMSILSFFLATSLPLGWISSSAASIPIEDGRLLTIVFFMLQIMIASTFLTFLGLYNLAATTVMYVYCKDSHDEVDSERKYVSLPFDDDDGQLLHLAYNNV